MMVVRRRGRAEETNVNARDQLNLELDALASARGPKVEERNCWVLAEVVRWTREMGHGDLRVSAISGMLALKFRVDSIVTVEGIASGSG